MASSRPRTRWSTTRSTSLSTPAVSYTTAVYAAAGRARSGVGSPARAVTPRAAPAPREQFRRGRERDPGRGGAQPPHLFGGQTLEHGDFADDLFHHYPPGFLVGLGRGVSGRGSTREAGNLLWHTRSGVSCPPGH